MAAYLLDTCLAIWYFQGSGRISADLRELLRNPQNDLCCSDVSVLEIVIKHRLGKLPLPKPPSQIVLPLARKHFKESLPLTPEAIFALEGLPDLHRDPFDRLLIAQALTHHLQLVSPDPRIRQYDVATLWL